MKSVLFSILSTIAIIAIIIAVVFGALGWLVELELVFTITHYACIVIAISVFCLIVLGICSFDWTNYFFLKAIFSGIVIGVASIVIYEIFAWQLFYTLFVIFAIITALAIVIGLIKTIFFNS